MAKSSLIEHTHVYIATYICRLFSREVILFATERSSQATLA